MRELRSPAWIQVKGALFLLLGLLASALLLLDRPSLKAGVLLALAIWGFCRFYYFAFYAIEQYIDPHYRFSGLVSMLRYLVSKRPKV